MDIPSDSLIRISVDYYDNSHLYLQSGTAWYLLGCIMQSESKYKEAMQAFKHAEDLLQATEENKTKALVDYNIGDIYLQDELYRQSLEHYKKSLYYYIRLKDIASQANVYVRISDMYNQLEYPIESVMYYSDIALKLSKESGDSTNYYSILSRQGELYYNHNYNRSKKYLLQGYRFLPAQRSELAAFLSVVYSKLNKPDSARYYLHISMADTNDTKSKTLKYMAGAYVAKGEGNQNLAFKYMEKAYLNRDSDFQKNIHSQLYRIDKQYDLTQKERENEHLIIANRNKVIMIGVLLIMFLMAVIILLLLSIREKKNQAEYLIEKQSLEYDIKAKEVEIEQKRNLLISKLQNKAENTLRFNRVKLGISKQENLESFIEEIIRQSILTGTEWQYYIDEINIIFKNKITILSDINSDLTQSDFIIIALICLGLDVFDSCKLLNMTLSTMYTRRKRIKKRIGLNSDIDLDKWIEVNIAN
jgi:tetratricopeptide (TPR) repeat protein